MPGQLFIKNIQEFPMVRLADNFRNFVSGARVKIRNAKSSSSSGNSALVTLGQLDHSTRHGECLAVFGSVWFFNFGHL